MSALEVPEEAIQIVRTIASGPIVDLVPLPVLWQKRPIPRRTKLNSSKVAMKRRSLARRQGAKCAYCGLLFADLADATLDHVIPYRLVGHWQVWNLVLACEPCNTEKKAKIPARLIPILRPLLTPRAYAKAVE